ncbi:MAG: isochorismatase family protein [Paracoccaceae bacterium]
MTKALVVIDTQQAFVADRDAGYPWANVDADIRIGALITAFRTAGLPVVHVHHHGLDPADNFHRENPLSAPMAVAAPVADEAVVIKHSSSAFVGTGLETMLREAGFDRLVLCGGAANYCVESTARMAGDLGFQTTVVGDALINFQKTLRDGRVMPAQDVLAVTLANLDGEFARIASSDEVLAELFADVG